MTRRPSGGIGLRCFQIFGAGNGGRGTEVPVADHCVLDYSRQPPRLCCLRCGTEETFTLPMPVRQLVVISDSFIKEHRRCQGGG